MGVVGSEVELDMGQLGGGRREVEDEEEQEIGGWSEGIEGASGGVTALVEDEPMNHFISIVR